MKKISLFAPFLFFIALNAHAATLRFVPPTSPIVMIGEEIRIVVWVDAEEEKMVTVKAALAYPPALLEFVSFTQASGWFPLAAPGYDVVEAGSVVKTAGFPGGFMGSKEFGTAAFRAPAAGEVAVSLSSGSSIVFNAQGVNKLTEVGSATLAVTMPTLRPTESAPGEAGTLAWPPPLIPKENEAEISDATSTQSAAIAEANPLRSTLAVSLLIILVSGVAVWRLARKGA